MPIPARRRAPVTVRIYRRRHHGNGLPSTDGSLLKTNKTQPPSRQWQISRAETLIAPRGGEIVAEYFDIGESRSLPWKRRPEATRLLDALTNPDRGFEAVVIGEPQRAFYGSQYGDTFPLFVHFDVELWVPRDRRTDRPGLGRARLDNEPLRGHG